VGSALVRLALSGLALAGLGLAGCSDGSKPPIVPGDAVVGGDLRRDSGSSFLELCKEDKECASGHCVQLGTDKRCTRSCDAKTPCPSLGGWSCNSQSVCECAYKGKQPQVCNVDGDCDGKADRPPTKEVCNDEDDDCDGKVDNVTQGATGAKKYYKDADGDLHGDPDTSKWLCKDEQGWVTKGDDCDDTRKTDNPDAEEICGDTYDNDCDGTKEDADICGLTPITVSDVTGSSASASMKSCGTNALIDKSVDLTEVLAKQDSKRVKFTLRLAGAPSVSPPSKCTSYMIRLGAPKQSYDLIYIYRPNLTTCGSALPSVAYLKGKQITSTMVTGFNAEDPGHVSFIIDKTEFLKHMPQTTYKLEACANETADAAKDLTVCGDSCSLPVHR
jgi:hypothetical protein